MNVEELRYEMAEKIEDVSFVYNGKNSGVMPMFDGTAPSFLAWYGDKEKEYSDIDDLMSDKFFDGKSLAEIAEIVEYT